MSFSIVFSTLKTFKAVLEKKIWKKTGNSKIQDLNCISAQIFQSDRPNDFEMKTSISDPIMLFALKHFAANLIKLMLHKKETSPPVKKYFEQHGKVEKELNRILMNLNAYLENKREEYNASEKTKIYMEALMNNEMLVHFEDVAQIDWKTSEGKNSVNLFSSLQKKYFFFAEIKGLFIVFGP